MSWAARTKKIEVGDQVCYSRKFLQSTGQYTGEVPFARGTVTALVPLGETTLAEISWNFPDLPGRVNIANLSRVTKQGIIDQDDGRSGIPLAEIKGDATSPAREVLEHLYQAILNVPEFTLRDGMRAKPDPLYRPEVNDDGDLKCGFDVLLDNGSHLEFIVQNSGWGKSFVAAKKTPPAPKGRRR